MVLIVLVRRTQMILEGVSWLVFAGCCEGEHLLASDIGRTNQRLYPARRTDSHPPTEVPFASATRQCRAVRPDDPAAVSGRYWYGTRRSSWGGESGRRHRQRRADVWGGVDTGGDP